MASLPCSTSRWVVATRSPIVSLKTFSEEITIKDCMESSMDQFLANPIHRPALFERHFNP
ncbi:histidine kinase HHK5p [Apiospora sp. TS-2023a]